MKVAGLSGYKLADQMIKAASAKNSIPTGDKAAPSSWEANDLDKTDNGNYSNTSPQVNRRLNISFSARKTKPTTPKY